MARRPHILLLTATITPKSDQPSLSVVDPTVRLGEYEAALHFYAALLAQGRIDGIVFAENSGFDLGQLASRFPSPAIEWLSIPGLDYPPHYHRGYGEFTLVEAAVKRSQLIAGAGADCVVWKVSGRYTVRNLANVVRWSPARLDYYGTIDREWAEMSVLAWSTRGFRGIVDGLAAHFSSGEAPERILFRLLQQRRQDTDLCIVGSFQWPPFIVGRRGTDGSPFQGRRTRYKFGLVMVHKLLSLPVRRLLGT